MTADSPKLEALTEKQRNFVLHLVEHGATGGHGSKGYTEAYMAAFPDATKATAKPEASKLMRQKRIHEAIREEVESRISAGGLPKAYAAMMDIIDDPGHKDRFRAAKHVAALAGVNTVQEHHVTHETLGDNR